MKARYQYRIYPTDQQRQFLAHVFGCVRVVFNDALALCKRSEKLPKNLDLLRLRKPRKEIGVLSSQISVWNEYPARK